MITIRKPAYAKVNLTLDVLAGRDDGYHDLQSIFQSVSLQDDIVLQIGTGEPWAVKCNVPSMPCDHKNLVWKAAATFCQATCYDPDGLTIEIVKRIPSEAGMGGGSTDAAAVLVALNEYAGHPLSLQELIDLGAKVGSDVPFCILGGTAFAEGRGERLRPISVQGTIYYVIVKPDLAFSTPKLFAKLDACTIPVRPQQEAMEKALVSADIPSVGKELSNVFEFAVLEQYPEISQIKEMLLANGALGAQMTGSGSVVFGVFNTEDAAKLCANALASTYPNTFVCHTV